jgi:ABC-type glycerol-3-phosphate transport system permease component
MTPAMHRKLTAVLQFFVGGLVTLGGAAYARDGVYPLGTALGVIHLSVGLSGLVGGYAFLTRKVWSRRFLIAINVLTILYSGFSESLAQVYSLLPSGVNDSLVGTVIAIVVSAVIIFTLRSRRDGADELRTSV